ncbi:transposase [Phytobacter diazotrophicus]|uniref:transposase n=1 Tax=Phytobacter diazotrophicus TaxID=395631 RepID=UPI003C6DEBA0
MLPDGRRYTLDENQRPSCRRIPGKSGLWRPGPETPHALLRSLLSAETPGSRPSRQRGMPKTQREHRRSAQEPWLLFSNVAGMEPAQIMTLYSRRMQIEQNFRDEKSPRFGFGLRLSRSRAMDVWRY